MVTLSAVSLLWIIGGYVLLSSIANAMDTPTENDSRPYRFTWRFLRIVTNSAAQEAKAFGIQLPAVATLPQDPTQASDQK